MGKRAPLFAYLALVWLLGLLGARPARAEGAAREVKVGAYLERLHAMSLKDSTFTLDFYLWFRWDPKDFPARGGAADADGAGAKPGSMPHETFEIVGASSVDKQVANQADGYLCYRVKAQLTQFWRVERFPFDDHVLRLVVEDSASDSTRLRYVPDVEGSSVSPELVVPGWTPRPLRVSAAEHEYRTSFGDPTLPPGNRSSYSQLSFELPVARGGMGLFFKLFTGLFVSISIALVAFFVRPTEVDPRFGLPVGALFAAVASEYVVAGALPDSAGMTLADQLHLVSFLAILAVVVESAVSLHLLQQDDEANAARVKRLDRAAFLVVLSGWLLAVAALVGAARGGA